MSFSTQRSEICIAGLPLRLEREWQRLVERYLPHSAPDSIWCYSRLQLDPTLVQGWKLHIGATILNAAEVLQAVAPFLIKEGIPFKATRSIDVLMRLNSGIYYGYSQVGKFITVYPQDQSTVLDLAGKLHRLTLGLAAPHVPFDHHFAVRSSVYYRYGAFADIRSEGSNGIPIPSIRSERGVLIPDLRGSSVEGPCGVADLLPPPESVPKKVSPLTQRYRIFEALAQRGKGGVYKAFDIRRVDTAKTCVVKEGRKHGELHWDGRDGYWRTNHEGSVLPQLRSAGVAVPAVLDTFQVDGNYYLVTEFIEGKTLKELLRDSSLRMEPDELLRICVELAEVVSQIHRNGWVWRDCKPSNLILTPAGRIRPIDFEGACRSGSSNPLPWSTPMYAPPEILTGRTTGPPNPSEDLFALGIVLRDLIKRFGLPKATLTRARTLTHRLIDADPSLRPAAGDLAAQLRALIPVRKIRGKRSEESILGIQGHPRHQIRVSSIETEPIV